MVSELIWICLKMPLMPHLDSGNGTQSITWQINEETYRQKLEADHGAPPPTQPNLQVYYGSIHDVLSYPCEVSSVISLHCFIIYAA